MLIQMLVGTLSGEHILNDDETHGQVLTEGKFTLRSKTMKILKLSNPIG